MKNKNIYKVTLWTISVILFFVFALAASSKFSVDGIMHENFLKWGYSTVIMFVVGVFEGVGAILLIIPKVRKIGILMLLIVMVGAAITHVLNYEELGAPFLNIALILVLIIQFILDNKLKNREAEKS